MTFADENLVNQDDEIFIEPPAAHVDCDKDSVNEDDGGMIHDLTGRQFRVPTKLKLETRKYSQYINKPDPNISMIKLRCNLTMTMAVINARNAAILDELEEVGNLYILNIERSKLRNNSNPFSLSSSIFKKIFRFEKRMMQDIIAMTAPFMRETQYLNAVPEHLKILTAVKFLATGSRVTKCPVFYGLLCFSRNENFRIRN
ncbi:hypothetical protein FQA39_LY12093 [Lamprigera yunnana]|nr:hypothetical protein FQA39_LY12093 [Lamprigera yunnana]